MSTRLKFMNKLFIDTNAFYKLKHNFDESNIVISALIKTVESKGFEYNNLSVIDNEIISDIKDTCQTERSTIKKIKWLKNYLDEKTIEENCFKGLRDYDEFKRKIKAINCNVSGINPEIILEQYFAIQPPFELRSEKRKEFPDAFIATYINDLNLAEDEKVYFITNDKGLTKSLNDDVVICQDIDDFLSSMNGILPREEKSILKYINENVNLLNTSILGKANIRTCDLEREDINVETVSIENINNIQVISSEDDVIVINCICESLVLIGDFTCFDYYNSYMPNDCDFYINEEYITVNSIEIPKYEFVITVKKNDNKYEMEIQDNNYIDITFDLMCRAQEEYNDYCVEAYLNREWHDEYR